MKKLLLLSFTMVFCLSLASFALAQDSVSNSALTDEDPMSLGVAEEITASELGVKEDPALLPSNPFYFLKNFGRAVQSTLTFNPEKKAELKLKEASTRLWEAKKMAEKNPNDEKVQALIEKSHLKYQKLMQKAHEKIKKMKENGDSERVDRLLEKVTDKQFKQQKLFDLVKNKMGNLSEEEMERLKQIKEQALERYGNLMEKVEDRDKVKERLDRVLEDQNGDKLKYIKDLEIMERLGDKFNDENFKEKFFEAKESIRDKVIDHLKQGPNDEKAKIFKAKLNGLALDEADEGYGLRVFNFLGNKLEEEVKDNRSLNHFKENLDEVKDIKIEHFKKKLEEISSDGERAKFLRSLEAGEMHSVEVLEQVRMKVRNPRAKEALGNAQERQIEHFNRRIERVNDSSRMEKLKNSIDKKPVIKNRFLRTEPDMLQNLDKKIELRKDLRQDRINSRELRKPDDQVKFMPSTDNSQPIPEDAQ